MKYITFQGTKAHPDSFRLAPHERIAKDAVVEVSDDLAKTYLKIDGFKATTKPKDDSKADD